MSSTDPRPPSDEAHTIYGRKAALRSESRRRRWIFIAAGLLVFVLLGVFIYQATTPAETGGYGAGGGHGGHGGGRGGRGGAGGGAGGPPTSVNAARAVQGDMPIYLTELGTVTPLATVTVIPQISGVLQVVNFKEGQIVKKGDFLAQIDPRPYEAALKQAEGTLAKDKAALEVARTDLRRYQELQAQNSIAKQTVDDQQGTVRQDEGQVINDQGAVDTQKLNLVYCHITAPVSGRVGLRQVDPGNYVTAGTANGIVVLTVLDPMDVLFTIPEDNVDQVTRRVRSGAKLEAAALDRAQSKTLATGSLLTLDNQVDTTTGTVRAKARFTNPTGALFPNEFVNLRLTVDTLKNATLVPTSAILKGPDGMFVYTAQKERFLASAHVTPVKVGPASGETTAVLSGLEPGAVVITDGSDRLKDGSRVFLPGDCIAGGGRGGRGGYGPGGSGQGASGASHGAGRSPQGGSPGFFGLFAKKPAQDPLAAMRCRPGEKPHSLLQGGPGGGPSAPTTGAPAHGAAPYEAAAETPATQATAPAAARGSFPASAPSPAPGQVAAPSGGQDGGRGEGAGGGHGGRAQALLAQLNLDPQQQAKAQAIFTAAREEAASSGDYRGAMQGAFAKLDGILRPDQKAKLAALRAQMAARRAQEGGGGSPDQ